MRESKVRAAICLSAPRSSRNLITERARSIQQILCSHGCHCLIKFRASPAVRNSLRQSILHGLSRQHTAIGQKILFVILIVHGFPHLLFCFSLFRVLTHRSISGHTSAMLTFYLHRSPCSCPAHECRLHSVTFLHFRRRPRAVEAYPQDHPEDATHRQHQRHTHPPPQHHPTNPLPTHRQHPPHLL